MARFTEEKIICQKLEKIKTADGEIPGGYESQLRVTIDGMLPGIQNDGQLNGQVQEYEASFTVKNNEIFGVKDISISNATNTGPGPKDEYIVGEEHKATVYLDDNQVTMKVENPGGTNILFVTYTIISKHPIELVDVETDENANYQVAQDYGMRNGTPNGEVTITGEDDMIVASWWMKRHVDKHIRDFMQGHDEMEFVLHGEEINVAGNLYENFKKKEGADPKSIVRNMATLIDIKIKLEELSDDKIYVIVEFDGQIFITTISDSETLQHVKNNIMGLNGTNLDACTITNQSTGKQLRDTVICKDIHNGQKNRNYFVAPRPNIKWVSFQSQD